LRLASLLPTTLPRTTRPLITLCSAAIRVALWLRIAARTLALTRLILTLATALLGLSAALVLGPALAAIALSALLVWHKASIV
jgi:hypothetical protein